MAAEADDVLDNWEDEDADVLARRMEERQKQQKKEKKKSSQPKAAASMKNQNEVAAPVPLEVQTHLPLRTQDTARTEYVAPIKILKRQADTKGASSTTSQSSTTASVQRKSLAEREADYASARARILGSGYRAAVDDASVSAATTSKSSPSPSPSSSRGPGGDVAAEAIKRQPKGPNGTKGFKARAKS